MAGQIAQEPTVIGLLVLAVGGLSTAIVALFWYLVREQRRNVDGWRERDKLSLDNQQKQTEALTEIKVVLRERLPGTSR